MTIVKLLLSARRPDIYLLFRLKRNFFRNCKPSLYPSLRISEHQNKQSNSYFFRPSSVSPFLNSTSTYGTETTGGFGDPSNDRYMQRRVIESLRILYQGYFTVTRTTFFITENCNICSVMKLEEDLNTF